MRPSWVRWLLVVLNLYVFIHAVHIYLYVVDDHNYIWLGWRILSSCWDQTNQMIANNFYLHYQIKRFVTFMLNKSIVHDGFFGFPY